MARKILITGGKGGVGKTTVTALLGISLARRGARVALIDTDFALGNLDLCVGLEGRTAFTLADVLEGKCRARQALVRHEKIHNLYMLGGGLGCAPDGRLFSSALTELDGQFEYLLLDGAAGVENSFFTAAACADEAILVVTPHVASLRDADKTAQRLKGMGVQTLSLFINQAHGDLIVSGEELSPSEVAKLLKLPVLGVAPHIYTLACEDSPTPHAAFRYAAQMLDGGKRKVYDVTKRYVGFFGCVRRALKRSL